MVHVEYSQVPETFNAKHIILADFANYGRWCSSEVRIICGVMETVYIYESVAIFFCCISFCRNREINLPLTIKKCQRDISEISFRFWIQLVFVWWEDFETCRVWHSSYYFQEDTCWWCLPIDKFYIKREIRMKLLQISFH